MTWSELWIIAPVISIIIDIIHTFYAIMRILNCYCNDIITAENNSIGFCVEWVLKIKSRFVTSLDLAVLKMWDFSGDLGKNQVDIYWGSGRLLLNIRDISEIKLYFFVELWILWRISLKYICQHDKSKFHSIYSHTFIIIIIQ